MSAHMERLLKRAGRGADIGESSRILELNGEHPAVQALLKLYEKDPADERIDSYGRLLYDQAVLAEGSAVQDPAAFARRINELITRDASG
jgi:molecular chaperone HtpG